MNTMNNKAAPKMPTMPTKRPRPVIHRVRSENELSWSPVAQPLYTVINGQTVRAGEAFACVRPGWERWPLGVVSDHYVVTDHNVTRNQIIAGAGDRVQLTGALVAGHGYHTAHSFAIRHMQADEIDGHPVKSKLVVTHDHTGMGSLRASMVVYVGPYAMGSLIRRKARHVAAQPEVWSTEIDGMIEKAILAQDALLDLLRAARARELTDVDREWILAKGIISKKGKNAKTLFDAMAAWFEGNVKPTKMTWNVWERRMDDFAIQVMCEFLGRAKFGTPLDDILGGKRYGKGERVSKVA